MNDKNLDSFIKQSLDRHSSSVPVDMWKRVQAEKDFDPFVKENLNNHSSIVPADMWQRIQDEKDFDTHVKEKLHSLSSPVPAYVWQRIRPEEKKRPAIIWWWAAAASLILTAGIGANWYFNHKPTPNNITENSITPSANKSHSNNTITVLPNQSASSVSPIMGHDSLTIPNANNLVVKTNSGVGVNSNTSTDNIANPTNPTNSSNKNNAVNQQVINSNSNKRTVLSGNNSGGRFNTTGKYITINGYKNLQGEKGNYSGNNLNPNAPITENGSGESLENQTLLNSNTSNSYERQLLFKKLIRSSITNNKLAMKQLLLTSKKIPLIICPTLGPPKRNDWYVEAFVSPDYVQKNLQDKPFGKNIKTGMDSTLHRQVSFSAGVSIVKSLGENFLVKTGVQYSQVNELFKYNSGSDTRTTTIITVRDVIIAPGDTIHIRDTSTVSQTGTLSKQNQNHYKQWDVPLIFGYEFGGNGFRLNANLGVIANIQSSYEGNMLDTTQKVIDVATYNNTGVYKTNIGFGVYLGLGFLKPLNDNMDLLVEPHARFNLSNMTTQAAIFNQKNTIFGLSVGIRYKLNNSGQRYR